MSLTLLDWVILVVLISGVFGLGVALARRASSSAEDYFLGGRSLPWWVLGTSMVATTFAADTPLAVTGIVREHGIWFNWFGWHMVFVQMLAVLLFSRLWRRAEVLTDLELIELRYDGRAAAVLRGFKAFHFAVIYNLIVLGWVIKGLSTVLAVLLGVDETTAVLGCILLAMVYSTLAGFWGVVATDVFQFFLAMISALVLAWFSVREVGGMSSLMEQLSGRPDLTAIVPWPGIDGKPFFQSAFFQWLIFLTVMWWSSHTADGGGYLIQRMMSAKDERHAQWGTLWFSTAYTAVRYWPWIVVALASLVLLSPSEVAQAGAGAKGAYPLMMKRVLGPGWMGLMLAGFVAAFMSTVDTHVNWGASYLVHDVWKRFFRPKATERETILVAKIVTVLLVIVAAGVSRFIGSIGSAWIFVWSMSAGIGAVLILRWFWWRLTAWSEIVALASSLCLAFAFEGLAAIQAYGRGDSYHLFETPAFLGGMPLMQHHKALIIVAISTVCWIVATRWSRPVELEHLRRFYLQVRPPGAWGPVMSAGAKKERGRALFFLALGWMGGCCFVLGLNGAIGLWLMGKGGQAMVWGMVSLMGAIVGGLVLARQTTSRGGRLDSLAGDDASLKAPGLGSESREA